jgi:hypothetical protein
MKKWSEIKQATLNKLFLDEDEAQQQGYLGKLQYLANEGLNVIANGVKPRIAKFETEVVEKDDGVREMPEDFLSFADMIYYLNGEENPELIYVGDKSVLLPKTGKYVIYYNALWQEISKEDISNDVVLKIDASVLNCLPTYIASQLLSQDDIQRSTILKNEFELMLSRLDTNIMYQQNHFKSTGGWY